MPKINAAILIIGNEILSGRTQDLNIQYIATHLSKVGIHLEEVRVVPDQKPRIISAVKELSSIYTYLFTTGGIGPTHDDITSDAMAEAFGRKLERNPEAYRLIKAYYDGLGREVNTSSARMADVPEGVELIYNSATGAPGFIIENIHVMAGVPSIMQAMMTWLLPRLKSGPAIESRQVTVLVGESRLAQAFMELQSKYPSIEMGSYPFVHEGQHATSLVLRSDDADALNKAFLELEQIVSEYQSII